MSLMDIQHGEFIGPDMQDDVLLHIPEEAGQYEWIDGHIREVSEPWIVHGLVCTEVGTLLKNYVDAHQLGIIVSHDTLFLLQEEPRIVYGPDLAFFDKSNLPRSLEGVCTIAPDLVVEVQSKSQRGGYMRKKATDFLRSGVRLVWVVDPMPHTVMRYRAGVEPVTLRASETLDGEDVVPGFSCPVADLFRRYCGL